MARLDDHHISLKAYALSMRREWGERTLITGLILATIIAGIAVYINWSTRYERVFMPVAGLSYELPQALGGTAISDISQPLTFQRLSANDAYRFNASVPVSTVRLVGSRPFVLPASLPAADAVRALDCLTAAVYYEAASESTAGQQAVAQVVLNRVRHSAFPNSVCGVVFSGSTRKTGCQFTFTCDGALGRPPSASGWARARAVARAALTGYVAVNVGQATHYHTLWVAPYWSPSLDKVANIGAHTFYRWKGVTGRPEAFSQPYAGAEPVFSMTGRKAEDDSAFVDELSAPPEAAPVPQIEVSDLDSAPTAVAPIIVPPRIVERAQAAPVAEAPAPALSPAPVVKEIEPERRRRTATANW